MSLTLSESQLVEKLFAIYDQQNTQGKEKTS